MIACRRESGKKKRVTAQRGLPAFADLSPRRGLLGNPGPHPYGTSERAEAPLPPCSEPAADPAAASSRVNGTGLFPRRPARVRPEGWVRRVRGESGSQATGLPVRASSTAVSRFRDSARQGKCSGARPLLVLGAAALVGEEVGPGQPPRPPFRLPGGALQEVGFPAAGAGAEPEQRQREQRDHK
jgi:hypothetical protein